LELLEADPTDANLYIIAVDALLGMSRANYAEASELLTQAQVQAQDQQALADWYQSLQTTLSLEVPYLADYLSPDEINTFGNLSGNLINGERRGGKWRSREVGFILLIMLITDFCINSTYNQGS